MLEVVLYMMGEANGVRCVLCVLEVMLCMQFGVLLCMLFFVLLCMLLCILEAAEGELRDLRAVSTGSCAPCAGGVLMYCVLIVYGWYVTYAGLEAGCCDQCARDA